MRPRRLAAAVLLASLLSACTQTGTGAPAPDRDAASLVASSLTPCPEQPGAAGTGAERLPALAFDCPGGGSLDLGRAAGVPTVVNLWGSWCPPCREEMPLLQEFAASAGDRVRVVGVISKDGLPQATAFAEDAGVTFPSAFDGEGEVMASLGFNNLPYTLFLAADGSISYVQVGPVDSPEEFRQLVADHLGVQL